LLISGDYFEAILVPNGKALISCIPNKNGPRTNKQTNKQSDFKWQSLRRERKNSGDNSRNCGAYQLTYHPNFGSKTKLLLEIDKILAPPGPKFSRGAPSQMPKIKSYPRPTILGFSLLRVPLAPKQTKKDGLKHKKEESH